jgi:RNA polymerase sigma-70 factor (ECF subfamily)
LDDLEFVRRASSGDVDAFNGLVERYQTLAYNVAYRTLGDREAAADATQDAFLSAFNGLAGFRGGSFKSWLLRIVTNACLDALRRTQRRPTTSLDQMMEAPGGEDVATDPGPQPEVEALRREMGTEVQRALLQLPFDQRSTVILCDLQGLSYDEITQVTGAAIGTVKSRINRGRLKLRELLAPNKRLYLDRTER